MATTIAQVVDDEMEIDVLEELLAIPDVVLHFSERSTKIIKYLTTRRFRNGVMHHLGDSPKSNAGRFSTQGGYTSYEELEFAMRDLAIPTSSKN